MVKWNREVLFYMTENQMDPQLDPTPNTLNEQFYYDLQKNRGLCQ